MTGVIKQRVSNGMGKTTLTQNLQTFYIGVCRKITVINDSKRPTLIRVSALHDPGEWFKLAPRSKQTFDMGKNEHFRVVGAARYGKSDIRYCVTGIDNYSIADILEEEDDADSQGDFDG